MKNSSFGRIFPTHSSSSHFLPIIYMKKNFFLSYQVPLHALLLCPSINHISGFSIAFRKDRVQTEVSAWNRGVRCCETEIVLRMDNLC